MANILHFILQRARLSSGAPSESGDKRDGALAELRSRTGRRRASGGGALARAKKKGSWMIYINHAYGATEEPGVEPPHEGTILLVPGSDLWCHIGDDPNAQYFPEQPIRLLRKAPHIGGSRHSVFLGQTTFLAKRAGREGEPDPSGPSIPWNFRDGPLSAARLKANMPSPNSVKPGNRKLTAVVAERRREEASPDLEVILGPGVEESLKKAQRNIPPSPAPGSRAQSATRSSSTTGESRRRRTASSRPPVMQRIGPQQFAETFSDTLNQRTGGSLLSTSTNKSSLRQRRLDISGVPYSGPPMDSIYSSPVKSSPVGDYTQDGKSAAPVRPSNYTPDETPRIGTWDLSRHRNVTVERIDSEIVGDVDSDGVESGDDLDQIRRSQANENRPPQSYIGVGLNRKVEALDGTSQAPSQMEGQEFISLQQRSLHRPYDRPSREWLISQIKASQSIPPYLQKDACEFISQEQPFIAHYSVLRIKPNWMLELCPVTTQEGEKKWLIVIINRDALTYTTHLLGEQVWQLMSDDKRLSAFYDDRGAKLDKETGRPLQTIDALPPVPAAEHAQVVADLEWATRNNDSLMEAANAASTEAATLKKVVIDTTAERDALVAQLNQAAATQQALAKQNEDILREHHTTQMHVTLLQRQLAAGQKSQRGLYQSEITLLKSKMKSVEGQLHLLKQQSSTVDDTIRRKAKEMDILLEQRAAEQRQREKVEAAREAEKAQEVAALQLQLQTSTNEEEKRRALFRLAALNVRPAGPGPAPAQSAPIPAQGAPIPAQSAIVVAPREATPDMDDELAALQAESAEAALLGEEDIPMDGGRGRRRRAPPAAEAPIEALPEQV